MTTHRTPQKPFEDADWEQQSRTIGGRKIAIYWKPPGLGMPLGNGAVVIETTHVAGSAETADRIELRYSEFGWIVARLVEIAGNRK